jgi:aryl-alcohol dehydrogenase-like predicted oxidoreductase
LNLFKVIPYSPLASGRLTRDWSSESSLRSETDQIAKSKYDATAETDRRVVERVAEIAEKHGVPRVHIALAWLLQKDTVTAPIIGTTKITHLHLPDNLRAYVSPSWCDNLRSKMPIRLATTSS